MKNTRSENLLELRNVLHNLFEHHLKGTLEHNTINDIL